MKWFTRNWRIIAVCAVLIIATITVYGKVGDFSFINFDDDRYILFNSHIQEDISAASIKWAFTAFYEATWQPMVWLSYMMDYYLVDGLDASQFHVTNAVIHALNVLLLFFILFITTRSIWKSGFVAALFAVHPLHVESVAWVAERKDVLSTFFWLVTFLAYVYYVNRPTIWKYALIMAAYALGLMSKPMLITLPFTLLLLDYWPLQRMATKGTLKESLMPLLREKIPLFIMALASAVITIFAQRAGQAIASFGQFGLGVRTANAFVAYIAYLWKMVYPVNLSVFYPHPGSSIPLWQVAGSVILFTAICIGCALVAKKHGLLAFGWLWYVATLAPVIGIIQTGGHAMADRFVYVPFIGIYIIIIYGISDVILSRLPRPRINAAVTAVAGILACCWILLLIQHSRFEVAFWQDGVTLFGRAVTITKNNKVAHYNYGNALLKQGNEQEAIKQYKRVLEIDPSRAEAYCNLGAIALQHWELKEAVSYLEKAVKLQPEYLDAHNNLGTAFLRRGMAEKAIEHYSKALKINPNDEDIRHNLDVALRMKG